MAESFFVHQLGCCESSSIGDGTKIWAFAHILPGAKIGKDCNICDHVFIENDVIIGDRVTIKCGVQLWNGLRIEDDVFVGPNVTFTNDPFPRSKKYPEKYSETHIAEGASIGANATILPSIQIGAKAMIGAGAVVTENVPPCAIVVGNPGRITGYVNAPKFNISQVVTDADSFAINNKEYLPLHINQAALYRIQNFRDLRGSLAVTEFTQLPFIPQRQFIVYNVPTYKVRGEHAHYECEQFLIAVAGSLSVIVDDGHNSKEVLLNSSEYGLFLPKLTWGVQYKFSADAILLVLASLSYDPDDYIRDYEKFLSVVVGK
jgi:acetyltransferase-like isoleucine patch superfamily enzyme